MLTSKMLVALAAVAMCAPALAGGFWAKGSVHCHTNNSDGDSPLQVVADWYKANGYSFVFITDHNKVTDLSGYPASDGFLLIPGEEISAAFQGKPVHVNALGIDAPVAPVAGKDMVETIQRNVDLARVLGSVALVNHPNWHYPFDHRELSQVKGPFLMEIANSSSGCNNSGDNSHISTEQMWDVLLSKGMTIYGVASDDAHCYTKFEQGRDNPGSGCIVARVNKLTREEVLSALRKGEFYASTGVELADYAADSKSITIKAKPAEGKTYRIRFLGLHGQILKETDGTEATYRLTGAPSEEYVRAKIIASDGRVAWTQPVRKH